MDDAAEVFGVANDFRLRLLEGWGLDGYLVVMTLDMMLFVEDTPEVLSAYRWRILISYPVLLLELLWVRSIFSSIDLSYGRGRLCAYCLRSVLRSFFVPNFAMSLLRFFTSGTPGSLFTVFVGEVRTTVLPGAHVSHRPRKSRLAPLETFLANFTSGEVSVGGIGFESSGWSMKRDTALFFSPLYLRPALVTASSMMMWLCSPVTHPLLSR